MKKNEYMLAAIEEAKKAFDVGEVPVGCIITRKNEIISILKNTEGVIYKTSDNKYGVMASDGTVLVEPTYDELTYAFNGNYIAKKDNAYGIINSSNETKVDFTYNYIIYMSDESFIEADKADGFTDILDTSFNVKVTGIISEINTNKGYVKVRVNGENKYYNFKLEERTAKDIFTTNTLFLSKQNGKYGYVNSEGIVVVDYIYDDATEQNDYGYVAVKQNGVWGALDQNGNVVEEWVSTGEPHYIYDLPTGTYTLEEVEAPEGYQLSTEKIEFEITKDGLVKEVVMYNSAVPEVPVPDTGVNDGVLPIAGASMMILGIGLVYRHAKKRA